VAVLVEKVGGWNFQVPVAASCLETTLGGVENSLWVLYFAIGLSFEESLGTLSNDDEELLAEQSDGVSYLFNYSKSDSENSYTNSDKAKLYNKHVATPKEKKKTEQVAKFRLGRPFQVPFKKTNVVPITPQTKTATDKLYPSANKHLTNTYVQREDLSDTDTDSETANQSVPNAYHYKTSHQVVNENNDHKKVRQQKHKASGTKHVLLPYSPQNSNL
jgi:hypothetical protein